MLHKNRLVLLSIVLATTTFVVAAMVNRNRKAPPYGELAENSGEGHSASAVKSQKRPRKPAADSKQKQDLVVSQNKSFVVYHDAFDPYKPSREPLVFTVADARTGVPFRSIPVQWSARYISSVKWVNDRYVLVRGEAGFLAVLDVEENRQTHNLSGSNFDLSPDQMQVVYSYDFNPRYGEIPPEYQSDYVLFSLIKRSPASGQVQDRHDSSNYKVIYPDPLSWGEAERRPFNNLNERHQIKGGFAWRADGRNIAFVENYRQRLWLVVLQLDVSNNDVAVSSRRFELGAEATANIPALIWMPSGIHIKVSGNQTNWLVNLDANTVQSIP
ncbi:MAG: hypothetical protein ABR577_13990 [Pyrinomonadaceae bacterium]